MKNDMLNGLIGKRGCVVWGGLLLLSQIALAEVIPSGRRADWSLAGIPGGIPNRTNIFVNVLTTTNAKYACTNAADVSVPLYNAIYDCPFNQVVYLPTGIYTLTNRVYLNSPTSLTIRGDGPGKTIIISACPNVSAPVLFSNWYATTNDIYDLVGEYPAGSSNITVADLHGTTPMVGYLLWIDQSNDSTFAFCAVTDTQQTGLACNGATTNVIVGATTNYSSYLAFNATMTNDPPGLTTSTDINGGIDPWYDRPSIGLMRPDETKGTRSMQHVARITEVNGTNITFWPPLYWAYGHGKQARALFMHQPPITLLGIESLTITNVYTNAATTFLIQFANADRCWIKDVELANMTRGSIGFQTSVQCEIDHCHIHGKNPQWAGCCGLPNYKAGYGIEASEATAMLIQDNILDDMQAPILMQAGSVGCVVSYNFFTNNIDYASPDVVLLSISGAHGPFPMMNLYEGNVGEEYQSDSNTGYNTIFRNWWWGTDVGVGSYKCAVSLDRNSLYINVVGNILGVPSVSNWTWNSTVSGVNSPLIFRLGYPCMGNNYYGIDPYACYRSNAFWAQLDYRVTNTIIIHGNYDYATKSTIWDPNIVDTNLPPSLYLTGKPSWWGSGQWPAIGPDLNPIVEKIPAQVRFEEIRSAGIRSPKIPLIKTGPNSTP